MDKRILNTKKSLKTGLLELLDKKPAEKITVRELCDISHVNRSTFYAYYKKPLDLLNEIKTDFLEDMKNSAERAAGDSDKILNMLLTARENRQFLLITARNESFCGYMRRIFDIFAESCTSHICGLDSSSKEAECARLFTAGGAERTVRAWIASGMEEAPEKIAEIIYVLAQKGAEGLSGRADGLL